MVDIRLSVVKAVEYSVNALGKAAPAEVIPDRLVLISVLDGLKLCTKGTASVVP